MLAQQTIAERLPVGFLPCHRNSLRGGDDLCIANLFEGKQERSGLVIQDVFQNFFRQAGLFRLGTQGVQ